MAKKKGSKAAARKKAVKRSRKKRASRTVEGRLTLPEASRQDLAFDELRDRVLIELAALAESDRAGDRPYKMVLVVKRGKTTPLSYKLVVERTG